MPAPSIPPAPPVTIAQLPEDLLAHVIRFATDSARRDAGPTPCTSLSDWRYASVSTSFRRAFHRTVSSALLSGPAAKALAIENWQPLDPCISIRRLHICQNAGLTDKNLTQLFTRFSALHRPLRHVDLTFDNHITFTTLIRLADTFGPHLTHLALRVPVTRRQLNRRDQTTNANPHQPQNQILHSPFPAPPNHLPPDDGPEQQNLPLPDPHLQHHAAFAQVLGGLPPNPQNHPPTLLLNPPQPPPPPENPANTNPNEDAVEEEPMDIANAMNEVHHALFNVLQTIDAEPNPPTTPPHHDAPAPAPPNPVHPPPMQALDIIEEPLPPSVANGPLEGGVVPNHFGLGMPGPADVANLVHATNQLPTNQLPPFLPAAMQFVPAAPFLLGMQGNGGDAPSEDAQGTGLAQQRNPGIVISDDVLASALSRMPGLKVLVLQRARHVSKAGILPLSRMTKLESLTMVGCNRIRDVSLKHILVSLGNLQCLHLEMLPLVGNPAIAALCTGPARFSMRKLKLVRMSRVTDRAVRQVVNACEGLEDVHISDCASITCETASHLSCAMQLKRIFFKPLLDFPISNRTMIYLSCAASTVQSLELVGCKNLSLDGIVALRNLPSLRRLHMSGLQYVSPDVMRQLGEFPKLDNLLLSGNMYLTDLGVKVLCGRRGHRFLYLSLVDRTKNLTDEALDCIMTWCLSLRRLQIFGSFKSGAMDRLKEFIPNATITVCSDRDGVQHVDGKGGVWDPIVPEFPYALV
eukprot:GFKZ01009220.1.p1 GENE.GFKZ01009220.1~~GFKZ01009220.1.p1  ORF type:complete len:801 (-),score=86.11 GFKZ01009220.1:584-2827(-)